jgi:hypothetical protein
MLDTQKRAIAYLKANSRNNGALDFAASVGVNAEEIIMQAAKEDNKDFDAKQVGNNLDN